MCVSGSEERSKPGRRRKESRRGSVGGCRAPPPAPGPARHPCAQRRWRCCLQPAPRRPTPKSIPPLSFYRFFPKQLTISLPWQSEPRAAYPTNDIYSTESLIFSEHPSLLSTQCATRCAPVRVYVRACLHDRGACKRCTREENENERESVCVSVRVRV